MFVGNDKGQVIDVNKHEARDHDDDLGHDDHHHNGYSHHDDDDALQVLKIVNFAGEPPSDGSSLPAPVLVEELQVIMVVMTMMVMMMVVMVVIMVVMVVVSSLPIWAGRDRTHQLFNVNPED